MLKVLRTLVQLTDQICAIFIKSDKERNRLMKTLRLKTRRNSAQVIALIKKYGTMHSTSYSLQSETKRRTKPALLPSAKSIQQ